MNTCIKSMLLGVGMILMASPIISRAQDDDKLEVWQPEPTTTWQIQLQGDLNTRYDVDMYDLDLFDTPQETIDALHEAGRVVICYFSAGTHEDWREDADTFPNSVIGKPLAEWPGEHWLDIRQLDILQPIMEKRLDLAVEKGCDGVDPDNVDAYQNDSGFALEDDDQLAYAIWLAEAAHERGLSIGLKNNLGQVEILVDYYDWALNEQCFFYDECELLLPFIEANKAVFGIEYRLEKEEYCSQAIEMGFSWLHKSYALEDEAPSACTS